LLKRRLWGWDCFHFSYQRSYHYVIKLEFDTTNNINEYEALLLGLKAAKNMGIDKLFVFGDSELIIHQIKNIY
jgi:ribonuclease HI